MTDLLLRISQELRRGFAWYPTSAGDSVILFSFCSQMPVMTRGEHLTHCISFALSKAQKVVRGLWLGLTNKKRWDVACKTVERLKEHGDRWKLNEELESPGG